jgi:hypothetical protein
MADELIYANGINGLTGEYLVPPLPPAELAELAKETPEDPERAQWLKQAWENISQPHFGLPFNVDPEKVDQAGWAIVFSVEEDERVKRKLAPLIEHRQRQIGDLVKVLDYLPDETWPDWLARHEVGPGNIDPRKVPYYVLLVGHPSRIPFSFQYLLDIEYAVGRLDFDTADDYGRYADALIGYERAAAAPHQQAAAFFGTRHPFDGATQLSSDQLVQPLADSFAPGGQFASTIPGYQIHTTLGAPATKESLTELLAGAGPAGRPALLFSATHGMGGWPAGHPDQTARHGALLCQDWPGFGQHNPAQYFAAADVTEDAHVHGMVAFFFACYGAGTPQLDPFDSMPEAPAATIANEPFVAALPKKLLSHPEGGALAVIGHIERAFGYSFIFGEEAQLLPFQNAVGRVLTGRPIGYAMKDLNEKHAALSANLSDILQQIRKGRVVPAPQLARLWVERNDAQNYVLLGDPAATLKVA